MKYFAINQNSCIFVYQIKQKVMKKVITLKGNNKQIREFANEIEKIIENNPADYSNVIAGELEYDLSYGFIRSFVALQPDRCGKGAKALISEAKAEADAKEIEYDEIYIDLVDNYEEENAIFHREPENEEFTVEESREYWEIYSNLFGNSKPATTYDKENWTYDEAVENYRKYGAF